VKISPNHKKQLLTESGLKEETVLSSELSTSSLGIAFPYYNLEGEHIGDRHKLDKPSLGINTNYVK